MAAAKKIVIAALLLGAIGAALTHWYFSDRGRWTSAPRFTGLARSASGNTLVSDRDPAVVMRFGSAYEYVGGQKFVLYGVADTEQHFFAETDAGGVLRSVFWIQFEAYLPDNSYRYDYEDSPERLTLGGYDFYVDAAPVRSDPSHRRRGTDGAMARQLLQNKGLSLPLEFAYARLVHLTDEARRKELMIIFIDDLAPLGVSAVDLQPDGSAARRWDTLQRDHLDKIQSAMTLARPAD